MPKRFLLYFLIFMFLVETIFVLAILDLLCLPDGSKLVNREIRDNVSYYEKSRENRTRNDDHNITFSKNTLVDRMIKNLGNVKILQSGPFFPTYFWNLTMDQLTRQLIFASASQARALLGYDNINPLETSAPAWRLVQRNIRQFTFYSPDDPSVDQLLHDMSSLPIVEITENLLGTQFKINTRLSDGGWALVKFMRYKRQDSDHCRYMDYEKHYGEIATFQLDRILGFYRIPPTVGRIVNIKTEMEPMLPESINNTLFMSPAGETCFYGVCRTDCDREHAFCGQPDMIEASMMSYLPFHDIAKQTFWQSWKTYWNQSSSLLCSKIRNRSTYNDWKIYLDMIDAHIFDFLTGNFDRHNFSTFKGFGTYTFHILHDNGRAFGCAVEDFDEILAPMKQCCLIRKSTLLKYIKLYVGPEKLSDLMEKALKNDPVAPVLSKGHLTALDRRVVKILRTVAECLQTNSIEHVVIDDRF